MANLFFVERFIENYLIVFVNTSKTKPPNTQLKRSVYYEMNKYQQ